MGKLTVKQIDALTTPGLKGVGEGLYLQVGRTGGKAWLFRYKIAGISHYMGLGSYPGVGLADASRACVAR